MRAAALATGWLILMAAVLLGPWLADSPTLGDNLTRNTIRVALLYYAVAIGGMLAGNRCRWVRVSWTLGWLAYLVHLGMAFHFYHHWSHAEAMRHTQDRSGYGEGIYASHLFTLVWTADVLAWWLVPAWYRHRPRWIGWALHGVRGFMAFIVFNATVVYETGFIRWVGVAMFVGFLLLCLRFAFARPSVPSPPALRGRGQGGRVRGCSLPRGFSGLRRRLT